MCALALRPEPVDRQLLAAIIRRAAASTSEWKKAYPDAKLWGLPAVARKRRDLCFDGELDDRAAQGVGAGNRSRGFSREPLMDEVVFLHRSSETAIFADLIENFSLEFLRDTPGWRGWRTTVALKTWSAACA